MKRLEYEILMASETALAHAAENIGNESIAMREKVRLPGGTFAHVPVITSDTLRHGLREAAAYATLDAAGIGNGGLSQAALRLLFNGGAVGGASGGAVNLDQYREMCDAFPPLAMLGGCASNRVIPGRVQVGSGDLVCMENQSRLPMWVLEHEAVGSLSSCRAHVEERTRVRMDATLDPGKRTLLTAGDEAEVKERLTSGEKAKADKDDKKRKEEKSTMMPRTFEAICAGSLWYWRIGADCYSDLDEDTWHVMVGAFLARAQVGGKKGTGHGKLRPVAGCRVEERRSVVDVGEAGLGWTVGEVFQRHMTEHKDALAELLRTVDA